MTANRLHRIFRLTGRSPSILLGTILLLSFLTDPLAAQRRQKLQLKPGETLENVVSDLDPSQSYAVFLPSNYQADHSAPVLILMDPRGRAMIPLELFRQAADAYGFVLISSYNTLSDADSAFAVNDRALSAMLVDAKTQFSVDPRRYYLVGFSGTAHYAWTIAPKLDGKLAGIMGVGGGLPAYSDPIQRALKVIYPFAFFATAGMADFNFDGVRLLDESLDSTRFAHRMMTHDGEHSWPPKRIADAAVEWFHLRAMATGLRSKDDDFIERVRREYMDEADSLRSSGRKTDAYRRYREIVQDFETLGGAREAEKRFEDLGRDRSVNRELERRRDITGRVIKYKLAVRDFYLDYRTEDQLPNLESALKKLKIEKLKKQATSEDAEEASEAKRMLATVLVNTGSYEPRDYLRAGDYRRAAGMLRIAMAVRPDVPHVCYQLARADAQLNELDEAFEMLACGLKAEWATPELVEGDELLDPLRVDPRYKAVVKGG